MYHQGNTLQPQMGRVQLTLGPTLIQLNKGIVDLAVFAGVACEFDTLKAMASLLQLLIPES